VTVLDICISEVSNVVSVYKRQKIFTYEAKLVQIHGNSWDFTKESLRIMSDLTEKAMVGKNWIILVVPTHHRRRLHGDDRQRPKSCGYDALKSQHINFVVIFFWNGKMFSKNYECVISQWQKLRRFQPENAPNVFVCWALPGLAGRGYSTPQTF